MGSDLKLIKELWDAAQRETVKADMVPPQTGLPIPYEAALFTGLALLKNKVLAQRFVDEAYEEEEP